MQLDLPHVLMPGSLLHGSSLQCRQASRTLSLRAPQAVLRSLRDFDGGLTPRQWLNACAERGWDAQAATGLMTTLIAEGAGQRRRYAEATLVACLESQIDGNSPRACPDRGLDGRGSGAPESGSRLPCHHA
ncbi:hypothetical protein WJ968_20020 [Achromobacter xylosoxidans]